MLCIVYHMSCAHAADLLFCARARFRAFGDRDTIMIGQNTLTPPPPQVDHFRVFWRARTQWYSGFGVRYYGPPRTILRIGGLSHSNPPLRGSGSDTHSPWQARDGELDCIAYCIVIMYCVLCGIMSCIV